MVSDRRSVVPAKHEAALDVVSLWRGLMAGLEAIMRWECEITKLRIAAVQGELTSAQPYQPFSVRDKARPRRLP